jgi:hypothetical protein
MPRTGNSQHRNTRMARRLSLGVLAVALFGAGLHPARAQQHTAGTLAPPAGEWSRLEVSATPYFWIPWTGVGVRPSNTRIPSASGTIDPGTLISHLTWVPFMGAIELRDGEFALFGDFFHAPLKAGINTHGILFGSATGSTTLDSGTALLLYRPIALPDQSVDVGVGMRAWGLDGGISLAQGLLPAVSVSSGESWADPIIAARYHRELGNGFSATAYADVGGFGVGAHIDWQIVGSIDYAMRPGIDLHAAFRSLNVNYGGQLADFNVNMYGPIISATFHF